ncbi:MBL fold metallo-hydrolase [Anaerocolumna sedimenticola]|uniref:MBL fold metallo-hydrolase n=1 Tax=Anaerocolumna sedimenticola TaxID=2696063 RepID=A0A6P1TP30_9FIRM|nr:MBL fold metallo-hydrolase [Anaerocolumna sedimenticola]QHQ61566.1 MBL fold metallo-hydrolase [Anaerocolumna sedimenticola]
MTSYNTVKIAKGFYSIEQDFVRSFLIEGDKEALLIDTGVGGGNLKEYVEQITKLPVTVIFTHGDGDHVGVLVSLRNVLCILLNLTIIRISMRIEIRFLWNLSGREISSTWAVTVSR